VREAAAGFIYRRRIDRRLSDFHVLDLSVLADDVGCSIAHSVRPQNAVCLGHFTIPEVAQKRERKIELIGKDFLGRSVIRADPENQCVVALKFRNTSLVCRKFLRSTARERGREERQYNYILAFIIREGNLAPFG
jgi:hypothetical protein